MNYEYSFNNTNKSNTTLSYEAGCSTVCIWTVTRCFVAAIFTSYSFQDLFASSSCDKNSLVAFIVLIFIQRATSYILFTEYRCKTFKAESQHFNHVIIVSFQNQYVGVQNNENEKLSTNVLTAV